MSEIPNINTEFFIVSFTMPLVLAIILIWFVISYQRRKYRYQIEKKDQQVKEQQLIIDKQLAVELERNRIAREMHDDLGSGLTTICFLSEKASRHAVNSDEKELINKITTQSSELVSNMSEIIWAMNARFDNLNDFIGHIRRYSSEYLNNNQFKLEFTSKVPDDVVILSGEKRRNLFLVIKELLHNAVKYSKSNQVNLEIRIEGDLIIQINEIGGIGFDPVENQGKGNGLYNIEKRITSIGGWINFQKHSDRMTSEIIYPLTIET